MKQNKKINNEFYNKFSQEDEIDLRGIFDFFLRNKRFIFYFSSFFFVLGIFLATVIKKTWEGQFEIVLRLNDSQNSQEMNNFNQLNNIAGVTGFDLQLQDALNTEVGILKSPSVLKPVYDLVRKDFKKKMPKKKFKTFKKWREDNLKISLEGGTTILDIKYRDKNKEIIIPVLNKMTRVYQDYSGQNRRRGILLTKTFLNDQIKVFKNKTIESIKSAQDFAIDKDLTILDLNSGDPTKANSLGENIGIEVARVKAANLIREIDIQIKKIKELEDENEAIQYITLMIPKFDNQGIPNALKNLEQIIEEMKYKYTENYLPLENLKKERKILTKLLKKRAIGFLEVKKINAEAKMEAARRPKGVLLKYKELIREANRDELTLDQLENGLRRLRLRESKLEDPWQLITNPTLEDEHVAPSKIKYGLVAIIIGFLSGSVLSYCKEKKFINNKWFRFFSNEV